MHINKFFMLLSLSTILVYAEDGLWVGVSIYRFDKKDTGYFMGYISKSEFNEINNKASTKRFFELTKMCHWDGANNNEDNWKVISSKDKYESDVAWLSIERIERIVILNGSPLEVKGDEKDKAEKMPNKF